eukprot:TRINITY_DN29239_c0_g1_i2.p1 TRINITY_DN29239_c0_g1~~TRINITY_DN29239_c0_g1_i2.p1  ORF type:complete len:282 (-),score=60.66 TRINITY_DN29239_c0_g1_i2:489-1289(-)
MASEGDLELINEYLLSKGGATRCVTTESKGRVLVATRNFDKGEIVYTEPPLHIIDENRTCKTFKLVEAAAEKNGLGYSACWYWYALNSLTVDDLGGARPPDDVCLISGSVQRRLVLLCAPDQLTEDVRRALRSLLASLFACRTEHSLEEALVTKFFTLLLAWKYNSFEYSEEPPSSAVYFQSSFHSHDCSPNANWTEGDDAFVLRARQRIEAGEEICISYLSDEELFESTVERRRRLELSKSFVCKCARCEAPWDTCRGVRCCCGD